MSGPLIGVTTSAGATERTPERAWVNAAYLRAVQQAGGVPVLLTPHLDAAARAALLSRLQGLVLTGGGDVDPARFGEPPHPALIEVSAERDELEINLVHEALGRGLPLLAICRGIQVLNVALGGSLHQHIPDAYDTPIAHSQKEAREQPTHEVRVAPDTRLGRILGAERLRVNSFHHQAINRLGHGLTAAAWAPDEVVEGAELEADEVFVIGVQWHPEDLIGHDEAARNLFRSLIEVARLKPAR